MALDKKDLELIERILFRNGDEVAVSIARTVERLVERLDTMESRLSGRLSDLEDRSEASRQHILDELQARSGQDCIYNHDHAQNGGNDCVRHD